MALVATVAVAALGAGLWSPWARDGSGGPASPKDAIGGALLERRSSIGRWEAFKEAFMQGGRISDPKTGGSTTSEGQGYGSVLAAWAGDRKAWEAMQAWTLANLSRPDGLLSWRWVPDGPNRIPDPNDASDGDILVAWGEIAGGKAFGDGEAVKRGCSRAGAVMRLSTAEAGGERILLPAVEGFSHERLTVNPSYYVFPAMSEFARSCEGQGEAWEAMGRTGRRIAMLAGSLGTAAGGNASELPLDWVELDREGNAYAPSRHPVRFGYESIRIPLYLALDGEPSGSTLWEPYKAWWGGFTSEGRDPPAWIDPVGGDAAEYAWAEGFRSVARTVPGMEWMHPDQSRPEPRDYYSEVLDLFARRVWAKPANQGGSSAHG